MLWSQCAKCHMVVEALAMPTHIELNHPKRHLGNLAALERAREVRREQVIERKLDAERLDQAWDGAVR